MFKLFISEMTSYFFCINKKKKTNGIGTIRKNWNKKWYAVCKSDIRSAQSIFFYYIYILPKRYLNVFPKIKNINSNSNCFDWSAANAYRAFHFFRSCNLIEYSIFFIWFHAQFVTNSIARTCWSANWRGKSIPFVQINRINIKFNSNWNYSFISKQKILLKQLNLFKWIC